MWPWPESARMVWGGGGWKAEGNWMSSGMNAGVFMEG